MAGTVPTASVRPRVIHWATRASAFIAALAMAAFGLSGTASAVEAQANLCGSSYALIDTYTVGPSSNPAGKVELYWSSTYNRNCALAIGTGATYGWLGLKAISICPTGNPDGSLCGDDGGDYRYYAGPAKTKAGYDMSGKCIDVYGVIERPGGQAAVVDKRGVHCG